MIINLDPNRSPAHIPCRTHMAMAISSRSLANSSLSRHPRRSLSNSRDFSFCDRRRLRRSPICIRSSSDSVEPAPIDVIAIGSRKDAVIDFCLSNSSAASSRFKFWTVHSGDSQTVQLLQRCHEAEMVLRDVEFTPSLFPCLPAMILVASTGHGMDHISALEILSSIKSTGGLAAAILLKPFSFEGQRRLEELDGLVNKLQECSQFYIVVEADAKAKVETLAEALESANNAVLLAMNAISVLMSEVHLKILHTPAGQMKELKSFEVLQLLEAYGKGGVGFGSGYSLRSAIMQAISNCPVHCGDLKDLDGIAIFTLKSACDINRSDFSSTILSFRRFTKCTGNIIFSRIYDPDLEPNLVVTTLLIMGSKEDKVSQKKSFLLTLALQFPFLFSFFGRNLAEPNGNQSVHFENKPSMNALIPSDSESIPSMHLAKSGTEVKFEQKNIEHPISELSYGIRDEDDSSETSCGSSTEDNCHTIAGPVVHRDQYSNCDVGPGFQIAQLWARERDTFVGSNQLEKLEIFTLPVGVKSSSEMSSNHVTYAKSSVPGSFKNMNTESVQIPNFPSIDTMPDAGLEAMTEICNTALTLLKGRNMDEPRKRGLLSERAASMLESERESSKSWTRNTEMQFRGGIYKGRCQGGLPEGKGCLTFSDGSFYDGMWHFGKRFGLGTFCYSNGDLFQGTWRDGLMHGKGWFYFHTGDRWFVNFWKGKANGEGRFYSNSGSIFFGWFQNGWRHGEALCIEVDGSRWTEVWEEGVLVSRTPLDKGS